VTRITGASEIEHEVGPAERSAAKAWGYGTYAGEMESSSAVRRLKAQGVE